jgi:diacylglycerol kinase
VKDIAAGAVLFAAIAAGIVGVIIFLPYILHHIHHL